MGKIAPIAQGGATKKRDFARVMHPGHTGARALVRLFPPHVSTHRGRRWASPTCRL